MIMSKSKNQFLVVMVLLIVQTAVNAQQPTAYWPMDVRDNPGADQTPDIAGGNTADLIPTDGSSGAALGEPTIGGPAMIGASALWLDNQDKSHAAGDMEYAIATANDSNDILVPILHYILYISN